MLLIALLLFCAAALIRWREAVHLLERPGLLAVSIAAVWVGPALFVALLGLTMPQMFWQASTSGVMVGLALVAAMPVANSSVGWTQTAGGNTAFGLALVVLSILVSPVATPQVLRLMGFALSAESTESISRVVTDFSGSRFIMWVILPSVAGMAAATLAGPELVARARPWLRATTVCTILLLNYANASLAMPQLVADETFATLVLPVTLAVLISVVGLGTASAVSRLAKLPQETRTALLFGQSMKHTGLALVLAGELLSGQPRVLLVIMLATLTQHLVAGGVTRLLPTGASEPEGA
ncbi:MAG: bile acid:sodium symporter [Planctomycetota bacterium]